jgi:hypothetical protein
METTDEKIDELLPKASRVLDTLQETADSARDAVWILSMLCAFFLNTHRTDVTTLEAARKTMIGLITSLSDAGESDDDQRLSH